MSIRALSSLPFRVGATITIIAAMMTALSAYTLYQQEYHESLEVAEQTLEELVKTVGKSAAVAAYLDNKDLAAEVVDGLVANKIVVAASITTNTELIISAGAFSPAGEAIRQFPLDSPFMAGEQVGQISLESNQVMIQGAAQREAWLHVGTMVLHSAIMIGIVILLIYRLLTKPLTHIAYSLHRLQPGTSKRLENHPSHNSDEIGQLTEDINLLLESAQENLDREVLLRHEVEALERRFRTIFESASGGIVVATLEGKIIMHNPSFGTLIGERQLLETLNNKQKGFADLFGNRQQVVDIIEDLSLALSPVALDVQLKVDIDTPPRWLHAIFSSVLDEKLGMLVQCTVYDISERTEREKKIQFDAEHDPLTRLYNRRAGEKRFTERLAKAEEKDQRCGFLLIDLDCFKPINDTHGHDAGDKVLLAIADRLNRSVRSDDFVIRWGGDEFVAVIGEGHNQLDTVAVAKKLLQAIAEPITLDSGDTVDVGASIGISVYPNHGNSGDQLIDLADRAMYQVKRKGRNGFCIHSQQPVLLEPPPDNPAATSQSV